MAVFDIRIHNTKEASILDRSGDITISDSRWDNLFTLLLKLFESVYFHGERKWSDDSDFINTLNYLSSEILWQQKNYRNVLFRVNESSMNYNRRLVSSMWEFYAYPSFVFLGDRTDESILANCYEKKMTHESILQTIDNCVILVRVAELNVLWIRTNCDINFILSSVKDY